MPIPYVTIHSIGSQKLSDEVGYQNTNLTFSFDIPCIFYTVRCNGTSYDTGIEIDTKDLTVTRFRQETVTSLRNFTVQDMRIMLANTEFTTQIFYTDLYQEGENRINIYGLSETWEWTPYDS
jgi:hypothetical protein